MISYQPFRTKTRQLPLTLSPQQGPSSGLNRVFAAAVVDRDFCEKLLMNPQEALDKGYLGESFRLSSEERDLIVSIRARTLGDLAKQVNSALGL